MPQQEIVLVGQKLFSSDFVIMDIRMPEMDGLEVLANIKAKKLKTPIIIVSGAGNISDTVEALKLGAWDYIIKPIQDKIYNTLEEIATSKNYAFIFDKANGASIMYANPYTNLNFPRADDIAAVQALYGTGNSGVTPQGGVSEWRYSTPPVAAAGVTQFLFKPNEFTNKSAFISLESAQNLAVSTITDATAKNQFVMFNTGGIGGFEVIGRRQQRCVLGFRRVVLVPHADDGVEGRARGAGRQGKRAAQRQRRRHTVGDVHGATRRLLSHRDERAERRAGDRIAPIHR